MVCFGVHPTELNETSRTIGHIEQMSTQVQPNIPGPSNNIDRVYLMHLPVYGSEWLTALIKTSQAYGALALSIQTSWNIAQSQPEKPTFLLCTFLGRDLYFFLQFILFSLHAFPRLPFQGNVGRSVRVWDPRKKTKATSNIKMLSHKAVADSVLVWVIFVVVF